MIAVYKFYFQDKQGNYYYINSNNVVDVTATKTAIKYSPRGWENVLLTWDRNFKAGAIFRKFSLPLKFEKDGAKILRSIYLNGGVNSYCKLVIEKFNNTLSVQDYEVMYDGEINFMGLTNSDINSISVEVIEGGFLGKLENRKSSKYEIDLYTNTNQKWVEMDGINLQCVAKYEGIDTSNIEVYPNIAYISLEGYNTDIEFYSQEKTINNISLQSVLLKNPTTNAKTLVLENDFSYSITFANLPSGSASQGQPYYFRVKYMCNDYTTNTVYMLGDYIDITALYDPTTFQTIANKITNTIILPSNSELFIELELYSPTHILGHLPHQYYSLNLMFNTIFISQDTRTPTSYIKVLSSKEVLQSLLNKINDDVPVTLQSDLLDHIGEQYVLTSFDSIRNLENSKLKTSFDDFIKSFNEVFTVGFDYKRSTNVFIFEEYGTFFDNNATTIDLGIVSYMNYKPYNEGLFNKCKFGYKSQTYDNVNGKDEFNTENEHLSPLTISGVSEEDFTSIYRADMYGIELVRLNLTDKKSTDDDGDNDVAILNITETVGGQIPIGNAGVGEDYYNLYRTPIDLNAGTNYWEILNIYSPETAYNIELSPKRCMLRKGYYLRSLLYGNDSELIKYQTSNKSNSIGLKMVTKKGTSIDIVDEGSDVLISSLSDRIFKPIQFEFKSKQLNNIKQLVEGYEYDKVSFTWKGNEYFGFILSISIPTYKETQTYKLLCCADTDLSKL